MSGHRPVLLHAAELLEDEAKALKASETINGSWELLTSFDREAKTTHDDLLHTATQLREIAALEAL